MISQSCHAPTGLAPRGNDGQSTGILSLSLSLYS